MATNDVFINAPAYPGAGPNDVYIYPSQVHPNITPPPPPPTVFATGAPVPPPVPRPRVIVLDDEAVALLLIGVL